MRTRRIALLVFPWISAATYVGCTGDDTTSASPDASAPDATFDTGAADTGKGPADTGTGAKDTGAADTATGGDSSPPVDAGVDASSDADAALWSPAALSGLVLWLDPTQGLALGDGGPDAAIVWTDRSGNNNNATSAGVASIADAAINGLPALHLTGTGYAFVADNTSLQLGAGDYTIGVVARHTTPTDAGWGYGMLFSKQLSSYPFIGPSLVANTESLTGALFAQIAYHQAFVTSGQTNYNDGQPFYALEQRVNPAADAAADADAASAAFGLRVNGADAGAATGTPYAIDVSAVGRQVNLGGTPASQNVVGDIAEVIVVKGSMSDADTAALEAYFKSKYGL